MIGRSYIHILQSVINRPLACTDAHAALICSALRGELDIETLITAEGIAMGRGDMEALAATGRAQAVVRQGRAQERERTYAMADGIAIIPIRGTLVKTWGIHPMSGRTGYDGIKAQLFEALEDPEVRGIWLDIESPGGQVSGLFDLADTIHAANERNGGKPIWAIADEMAASAAFVLASSADKLFTPRTGTVGSCGIVTIYVNERESLEMQGLHARVFRSSQAPKKFGMNPIEDPSDEAVDKLQAEIDMLTGILFDTVARNLRLSKKAVAATEGDTYIGEAARALGFVSAVASWDQAWTKFSRYVNR